MEQETLGDSNGLSTSTQTMTVSPFPHIFGKYRYSSPCYNHINITVTILWVATPFLSTVSVAAVCAAVSTNQWLLTQENIKNENYTGRGDQEYLPKNTISGLWTLCYTKTPGSRDFFCSNIEYFPKEEYSPDLKDSTMAIPYTVTKSAAFFIFSTFLLFIAEICCLCGHFSRQRRVFIFISGVIFIISGLLMLIGLVMYISIFKAEVGGKLRPSSQLQPAVFTYKYGYSFILYVTGFVSTEISGTCAVFLYIYWHQIEWTKKGNDFRVKFVSSAPLVDVDPSGNLYPFCRRHPQYLSSNVIACSPSHKISEKDLTPVLQRRLFLDRYSDSNSDSVHLSPVCQKHSTSYSVIGEYFSDFERKRQNRKVGTDDIDDNCPPTPSHVCQLHLTSSYKHELVLQDAATNTMSDWEIIDGADTDECSSSINHDHNFVPFDLDDNSISAASPMPNSKEFEKFLHKDGVVYEVITKTTPV